MINLISSRVRRFCKFGSQANGRIAEISVKRDGMTQDEAKLIVNQVESYIKFELKIAVLNTSVRLLSCVTAP